MGKALVLTARGPWKKYVELRPDTHVLKQSHGIEALLRDLGIESIKVLDELPPPAKWPDDLTLAPGDTDKKRPLKGG